MVELDIERKKLASGLTLVKINLPNYQSITNLLAIKSGSRYENQKNNGVAHFLEHLVFKGTKKYQEARVLSEAIESVGGRLNAWTANDHTAYHNVVPKNHPEIGLTLPFELAYEPLLKEADMERERTVIIEEINRINDDPASLVDDKAGEVIFPNHPLGYPIIGSKETIHQMTIEQFKQYHQSLYHPSNSLFVTIGAVKQLDVESLIKPYLARFQPSTRIQIEPYEKASSQKVGLINRKTDQTHFIWAVAHPKIKRNSPHRSTMALINVILGRGMSSRLFLNIREKKGLAYSIHSNISAFEDTGVFSIYGGVNNDKALKALEAVKEEITNISEKTVQANELNKAKEYVIGGFLVNHDNPYALASWYGVNYLLGVDITLDQAIKETQSVTAKEIKALAAEVFAPSARTLTLIGPHKDEAIFQKVLV